MDTIEIDGLTVAYERTGAGPPVVLLHGYVGDGPTTWRSQVEGLSDEFTVVVWDAPGAGASSDPPESFGMAGYADCLARFVDALGLEAPHFVGLSFGGALLLELHRRHRDVARSLTLVSAYAGWTGSLGADAAAQRLEQADRLSKLSGDEFVDTLLPTMFSESTPKERVDEFGASMRAFHPVGFRAMARASAEDLRSTFPHIDVPTLLVYGDADVRAPLEVARAVEKGVRGSELVVLPGAGHLCNVEVPGRFNEAVGRFVRAHSGEAERAV